MTNHPSRAPQERHEDIVNAATKLFGVHGYRDTTADEIAEAAHVTKRTLYRHTGSKEKILLLIHEKFLDEVETVRGTVESEPPEAGFRRFVNTYVRVVAHNQSAIRVFFEEMKNLSPENREAVVARRDAFEAWFRDLIAAGVSRGEFVDCDLRFTAAAVLGALANVYRWYSPQGPSSCQDIGDLAADLFLHGLALDASGVKIAGSGVPIAPVGDAYVLAGDVPIKPLPEPILSAGIDLFVARGYRETSTREIAHLAGITKSALFYHVGSKEELLFAIQDDFARRSLSEIIRLMAAVEENSSVVELINRFIERHCEIMDHESKVIEIFTDQLRYLNPDHQSVVSAKREAYTKAVEKMFADGIAEGTLRALDPKIVALLVIGMLNSMYRWYRPGGRLGVEEVAARFAHLLLYGLRAPR